MKKNNSILLLFIGIGIILSSCGDGASMKDNAYLGQLPSISKKYQDKEEKYEEKAKNATDMDDAYKYGKEAELADDEGDKAIKDYLATKTFDTPLLFDGNSEYKFEILDLNVEGASKKRINLIATVKIKEDLKNKYGGFEKTIFAYIKAVDKEGNILGKPTAMASLLGNKDPFMAEAEAILKGSIGNLREFEEFDKIIFLTKEEYNITK